MQKRDVDIFWELSVFGNVDISFDILIGMDARNFRRLQRMIDEGETEAYWKPVNADVVDYTLLPVVKINRRRSKNGVIITIMVETWNWEDAKVLASELRRQGYYAKIDYNYEKPTIIIRLKPGDVIKVYTQHV